jgi:hypothetical protein
MLLQNKTINSMLIIISEAPEICCKRIKETIK